MVHTDTHIVEKTYLDAGEQYTLTEILTQHTLTQHTLTQHTQSGDEPEPVRRAEKRWHAALADGSESAVLEAQTDLMAAMLATQFGPVQVKDHCTLTVTVCTGGGWR